MQSWVKSFMSNCKYTVKIGNNTSESWFPHIGVGQGRRLSPILFNIGCLSMQFWEKVGKSIVYADDGCTIISGDTMEDLNRNIEIACYDKTEWYQDAGFVINGAKSELLGINCKPDPITVAGHKVLNKSNIKFLGLHITHDLKWNVHINKLCDKARFAANKIRSEGWCFSLKDRALLYNGWVRSLFHTNAVAFLPFASKTQMAESQRAMNSGIRAIYGIARFGYEDISNLSRKLHIPGIVEIRNYVCQKAAWLRRSYFRTKIPDVPRTRSQTLKRIPLEDSRGWLGKSLNCTLTPFWNELPLAAKECEDSLKLTCLLKKHVYKFDV